VSKTEPDSNDPKLPGNPDPNPPIPCFNETETPVEEPVESLTGPEKDDL
jgi:hypothetical protein